MKKLFFFFLAFIFTANPATAADNYEKTFAPLVLQSGKQIKILGYSPIYIPNGEKKDSSVIITYETKIPLGDLENLSKEADEVWLAVKPKVESGQYANAILSANEPYTGYMVTHKTSYDFTYKKGSDGQWRRM